MGASDSKIEAIALPLGGGITASKNGENYITTRKLSLYCYITNTSVAGDYFDKVEKLQLTFDNGSTISCEYTTTKETENVVVKQVPTISAIDKWSHGITGYKRIRIDFVVPPTAMYCRAITEIRIRLHYKITNLMTGTIENSFTFANVYKNLNNSLSGSGICFNTQYGNNKYRFQNYYDSGPNFSVKGLNLDNQEISNILYSNKIKISIEPQSSLYILGYKNPDSAFDTKTITYKCIFTGKSGKKQEISYSIKNQPSVQTNRAIYIDSSFFSNFSQEDKEEISISVSIISVYGGETFSSNNKIIKRIPVLQNLFKTESYIIRPNYYELNQNQLVYNPKIEGKIKIQLVDPDYINAFQCTNGFLIYTNQDFEFSVKLDSDCSYINEEGNVSFDIKTSFNKNYFKYIENLGKNEAIIKLYFTDIFGIEQVVNIQKDNEKTGFSVKEKENLIIVDNPIKIVNTDSQGNILYDGNILVPGEKCGIIINYEKIFIPHLHSYANAYANAVDNINFYLYTNTKEQKTISGTFNKYGKSLSYYDLINTVPDNSTLIKNNILTKTFYCFLGIEFFYQEKNETEICKAEMYKSLNNYIVLGRIANIEIDKATIDSGILTYKLKDNGGDRNDYYNYNSIASLNINNDTSLSRTYMDTNNKLKTHQKAKITFTFSDGNDPKHIILEDNGKMGLDVFGLRKFLIENQDIKLDLSLADISSEKAEKITEIALDYYYGFNDNAVINTKITRANIQIITERVPFSIRSVGSGETKRGGIKINGYQGQPLQKVDNNSGENGGVYFVEINALNDADKIIFNFPNTNAEIYYNTKDKKIHLSGFIIDP